MENVCHRRLFEHCSHRGSGRQDYEWMMLTFKTASGFAELLDDLKAGFTFTFQSSKTLQIIYDSAMGHKMCH